MAKLLRNGYSYHQSEHLIGSSPGGSGGFPLNARQVVSTGSRLNPTVYGYTFLLATLNCPGAPLKHQDFVPLLLGPRCTRAGVARLLRELAERRESCYRSQKMFPSFLVVTTLRVSRPEGVENNSPEAC